MAGATTLQLAAIPEGWRVGDELMIAGTQQLHKKRNILYSISFTINPISALNPLFRTRRSYIMDQPRIKRQSGILLHLLRGTERKIMSLLFLPGFYPGFDQF